MAIARWDPFSEMLTIGKARCQDGILRSTRPKANEAGPERVQIGGRRRWHDQVRGQDQAQDQPEQEGQAGSSDAPQTDTPSGTSPADQSGEGLTTPSGSPE